MAMPNKVITEKLISEKNHNNTGLDSIKLTQADEIASLLKKIYSHHSLLTVSLDSSEACYGSTIIEINNDEHYIVVDELYPTDGHNLIKVDTKISVSAHHAGAFVNFSGTIEAIGSNEDAAYYKIGIPKEVEFHQRRNTYRVATSISDPIVVNLLNEEDVLISAELRDISLGGVCLRMKDLPHIQIRDGEHIPTCLIKISDDRKILSSINICHVERIKETGSLRIGAEFASISNFDQRELEHLIATLDREIIKKIKRTDTRTTA